MSNRVNASPVVQSIIERLQYAEVMASFDPARHLKEREDQYVDISVAAGGILIVRETADGWWKESMDIKNDKQLQKLIDDPVVVCGWLMTSQFTEKGRWADPNG